MTALRLGVIGCGVIGHQHLRAAQECCDVETVALADVDESVANASALEFGVETTYFDATSLLRDPGVDMVILALPAGVRTAVALEALAHGKHTLLEKPVAMNAAEVQHIIDVKGDLVVACGSARFRLGESASIATELLATGAIGELRIVRSRGVVPARAPSTTLPPVWRLSRSLNGGGIMMNWGSYDLDYLLGLTCWSLVPARVLARTWSVPPHLSSQVAAGSDAETAATALVTCRDGTAITVDRAEYTAAVPEDVKEFIGSAGSLRLAMGPGTSKSITLRHSTATKGVVEETVWTGDESHSTYHQGLLDDFAAAVRSHRQPATSIEHAWVVARITDAIYASADTESAVEIPETT